MTRKVLISPGYGAGWSTWNTPEKELATDEALIALVERGEHLDKHGKPSAKFKARATEICGGEEPYCGGVPQLEVRAVHGPFRIQEYDGNESLETREGVDWW